MNTQAPVQTSPVPPSIALAMMAMTLAEHRAGNPSFLIMYRNASEAPASRTDVRRNPGCYIATGHWYRILDRISAGVTP